MAARSRFFSLALTLGFAACQCDQEIEPPDGGADAAIVPKDAGRADALPVQDATVPQDAADSEDARQVPADGSADATVGEDAQEGDAAALDGTIDADGGALADADLTSDATAGSDAETAADAVAADAELDAGSSLPDAAPTDRGPSIDFANLNWSIQVMIDPRATVFGSSQGSEPRFVRGIALSPDHRYLYAGYNNTSSTAAEVRQIDLSRTGSVAPFVRNLLGYGSKSIAVDDTGRVYLAGHQRITVHTATLSPPIFEIGGFAQCEGVSVNRENGQLVLYTTDRALGTVERRLIEETDGRITGATLAGLGGTGRVTVDPGGSLRNARVDRYGRVWTTALTRGRVYRMNSDGTNLVYAEVTEPFDVGFDGPNVIVTHNFWTTLTRLDIDTLQTVPPTATPPWAALGLDPLGQNQHSALTGLIVLPNVGFFVANEAGATVESIDPVSGLPYRQDDPILWVHAP